ncbi:hypothetical protein JCM8547_000052 [Rhodosporidiobolus lusitaniae]
MLSALSLVTLATSALAAPLLAREYSDAQPVDTCNLQLNQSVTTQIRHSVDTRSAWVPQQDDNGTFTGLEVSTLSSINPPNYYWTVAPSDKLNGTHTIQLNNQTSPICASGAGSGTNSTLVDFVDCDSDYALWNITCERCTGTFGGECEFSPVYRAKPDDPTDQCVSVPHEQYGAAYLKTCNLFVSPPNYEQLFFFGSKQ